LKPEQWGSPLVQEKYQEEKACDKRHPYHIIIITIIIAATKHQYFTLLIPIFTKVNYTHTHFDFTVLTICFCNLPCE